MCCPSAVTVSMRSCAAVHCAMCGGRDIFEEHYERLEPRKRARAIVPTEPAAPPNRAQLLGATQVYLASVEYNETDAVIYVEVKDELTDTILEQGDAISSGMLALCQGAYFKTDVIWKGVPVWKSLTIPQRHNKPMTWLHYDTG